MKIGILWDLDGTLLDTIEDLTDSVNYAMAQFGYPQHTREAVLGFVGNGARYLIARAVPEGVEVDPVLEVYQRHYKKNSQNKTKPYDGILEALSELKKTYPMAVVSNKPDAAVKLLCADYFPGIYARGESEDCPRKPAPDMVQRAMAEIGVDTCIYVGDSEVDVVTAKNAGVPCLSVLWGFRDKSAMEQAGGQFFCEKPALLPQKIEEMVGFIHGK